MSSSERANLVDLVRRDAARWIEPEEIGDPDAITPRVLAALLFRHPALRAIVWFRIGGFLRATGVRGAGGFVQRRLLRVYGLDIEIGSEIAGGCYIAHPSGCTISATRIGFDATIIAAVTVGANKIAQWPVLGDRVFLGAGCRVLGPITVGDDAKVGANAVVLTDVGDAVTMVGIPARPVGGSAR